MSRLNDQDMAILERYARDDNRELYWNYLASRSGSDGYGLLALGVVRNDNMPGAVANAFAESAARGAGVRLTERGWNEFGVNLMELDLKARQEQMRSGRPDLALNLPANDVMDVHDRAFRDAGIPVNAWTPREYLAAARRHGEREAGPGVTAEVRRMAGDREMETAWDGMLNNVRRGVDRGAGTLWGTTITYNDRQLDAADYQVRMAAAYATAGMSRSNQDPDRIGAGSIYYQRRDDGRWFFVNETVSPLGMAGRTPREERDPARLRELEDTRNLRLEIRDKRDDFHPQDPARTEGLRRSPRTLAEAQPDAQPDAPAAPTRLAAAMDQPGSADHALYLGSRGAVERMEAGLGRTYDDNSEKLTRAATVLARQNDFERVDAVALSIDNGRGVRAGENLFVVQGQLDDPAQLRAVMKTDEALARTPAQNEQLLAEARDQALARSEAQERERAQATLREASARSMA